jgi:hypothetical protein
MKKRVFNTSHGEERDPEDRLTIDVTQPVFTTMVDFKLRPYIMVEYNEYFDKILQVGGLRETKIKLYAVAESSIPQEIDYIKYFTIETDKNGIYIDREPFFNFRTKDYIEKKNLEEKFILLYGKREDGGDGPAVHGFNVPFDIELIFVTKYMSKFYFLSWLHLPKGSERATDLDVVAEDPSSINKKLTTYCSHGVF